MPRGVYERKPKEEQMTTNAEVFVEAPKMFPVVLSKNYSPAGPYEIIGYLKPAVQRKDAAGNWRVIEKEQFIEGEMKPHDAPGVGYAGKIWAGTHIRLPLDEAKSVVAKKIAERADAIAA